LVEKDNDDEERISEIIDNFMRIFSNLFGFPYASKKVQIERNSVPKKYKALDISVFDKGDKIEVYINAPGLKRETIKVYIRDGNLYVYGKREDMELFEKIDLNKKGKKIEKWDYVNGILSIVILKKRKIL